MRHKNGHHNDRAGREGISAKTEFVPQGLVVTHDLVRHAETKLVALHANRSQLRRRIRALHYLLKTLNTDFSSPNSADPALQSAPQSQVNNDEFMEGLAAELSSAQEPRSSMSAATEVSTELRRACRIALMESERPQSCEQILERIRRRESVCIAGFHNPVSAIAQELRAMLADYEVISKKKQKTVAT